MTTENPQLEAWRRAVRGQARRKRARWRRADLAAQINRQFAGIRVTPTARSESARVIKVRLGAD